MISFRRSIEERDELNVRYAERRTDRTNVQRSTMSTVGSSAHRGDIRFQPHADRC